MCRAANFGYSNAARVVGYRGKLLFKAPGYRYFGYRPGATEAEPMEEQMVCCGLDWMFVRLSVANNQQKSILFALDGNGTAKETWSETTSYADAWRACCRPDNSAKALVFAEHHYIALQNLWDAKKRALFYNGRFLKEYDWRGCSCNGLHTGCNEWRGNRFHAEQCVAASYSHASPPGSDPLAVKCSYWGELWFGKWIHNPQTKRTKTPPSLLAEDKEELEKWLDAFPMMGIYIMHGDNLVSINPGSEAKGGRDIQEKMPPDPAMTPFSPSGDYWYINDRNAPVRYDKQVEESDQAWNHNCGSIPITLSAQSLDDLLAAPSTLCQGKRPQHGIEGVERGRLVIGGNNVLAVFDSSLGRMDFDAATFCQLR